MSLTRTQARSQIYALVKTGLDQLPDLDPEYIFWDGVKSGLPTNDTAAPQPWARVQIRHSTENQGSLSGGLGSQRYDRIGLLTIQYFALFGRRIDEVDEEVRTIQNAIEGKTTLNGVWFRNARAQEIGKDGPWYQTNILADFEYDEIK